MSLRKAGGAASASPATARPPLGGYAPAGSYPRLTARPTRHPREGGAAPAYGRAAPNFPLRPGLPHDIHMSR